MSSAEAFAKEMTPAFPFGAFLCQQARPACNSIEGPSDVIGLA